MAIEAHTFGNNITHQDLPTMDGGYGFGFVPQQTPPNTAVQPPPELLMLHHSSLHASQHLLFSGKNNVDGYNDTQQCSVALHHHHHHGVSPQIEQQRMEFDRFVGLQNERLRRALQEQRRQQIALLVKRYEANARLMIERRDEEISKEAEKTARLRGFLERMEAENLTWQRLAKEKESTVQWLKEAIERAKEEALLSAGKVVVDDEGSCCELLGGGGGGGGGGRGKVVVCRCCNDERSCVVMLPCRHLCSCRGCEALLDSCPVCNEAKKASLEALF